MCECLKLDEFVARVSAPIPDSCQTVLAFIRRAACRTALPTPFPGSRQGATRKVKIRSFLEFHTHRWVVCMHMVWHKLDIHGKAPEKVL